jgi:hypothetical protein
VIRFHINDCGFGNADCGILIGFPFYYFQSEIRNPKSKIAMGG